MSIPEQDLFICRLLDSIGDAVILCDQHDVILTLNAEAEILLCTDTQTLLGTCIHSCLTFQHSENHTPIAHIFEHFAHLTQQDKNARDHRCHLIVHTRNTHTTQDTQTTQATQTEKIIRYAVVDLDKQQRALIMRDMSDDYLLKLRLQESENMQSLGRLTGGIAHDFNNMLGSIMGAAQILDVHLQSADEHIRDYTQIIMRVSEHAAELVRKLSAFSRKDTLAQVDIEVNDLVQQVISIAKHAIDKRIVITHTAYKRDVSICGDPTALQSALLNMCINAQDAIPHYGTLHIRVATKHLLAQDWKPRFRDITDGDYALISIHDSGKGMDSETCARIFEPFFTTKDRGKGTGLGLAAVYGTITSHGGCIDVHSTQGNDSGTCFSLYIPLSTEDSGSELRAAADPNKKIILLVDDDDSLRPVIRSLLENLGHCVAEASSGEEAMHIFHDMHDRISLVLLDLVMPEMSGRTCFEQMRTLDAKTKIILISGFDRGADADQLLAQGALAYLRKPFKIHEMIQIIKDVSSL